MFKTFNKKELRERWRGLEATVTSIGRNSSHCINNFQSKLNNLMPPIQQIHHNQTPSTHILQQLKTNFSLNME